MKREESRMEDPMPVNSHNLYTLATNRALNRKS